MVLAGAGRGVLFAFLLLAVGAASPAWAGDGEDCSWPEPAQTLLKTNPARLVSACRRLADQGNVAGQLNLGFLYATGRGVPRNHAEAAKWWRDAADQGSARAHSNLRLIYRMDWGALRDQAEAPTWQETAAEPGSTIPKNVRNAPVNKDHDAAVVMELGGSAHPPAAASPQFLIAALRSPQTAVKADIARLPKWQRVRDWMVDDAAMYHDPALSGWVSWAATLRNLAIPARLDAINRRVNAAFLYASDYEVWGIGNYWGTPSEIVAKGATDCKGFVIMKFWLARLAGLDSDHLSLLVGILAGTQQMHAVLLVGANGTAVVLDNLHADVFDIAAIGGFRPLLTADLRGLTLIDAALTAGAK
jgi:predicted transglutaminase-like cysteine proteinase